MEGEDRVDRQVGVFDPSVSCGLPGRAALFPGVSILYCARHWIAVVKPSNLLIHRTRPFSQPNLVDHLRMFLGESLVPVNRLDRVTSGIVLLARGSEAARVLGRMWADRRVEKSYLAVSVCRGEIPAGTEFLIDAPIGMDVGSPIRVKRTVSWGEGAAAAQTEVRILAVEGSLVWTECRPRTGRTHQIRCHLAHVGLPIMGDLIYGRGPDEYLRRAQGLSFPPSPMVAERPRLALHAWGLRFEDPTEPASPRVFLHCATPDDVAHPADYRGGM